MAWVVDKCQICNVNSANREPLTITPIKSRRVLDRVYIDLMDFTLQPDTQASGVFKWVLQIKDHFSRMIWLYPLLAKTSAKVARCLSEWFSHYGSPCCIYADNGTEFKGDVSVLLASRSPPIPIVHGRLYYPQTQGSVEVANGAFKDRLAALRQERGENLRD